MVRALLTVLVFVLPLLVTVQLKHLGERGFEAERDLQAVATEVQVEDGLERRINGRRSTPEDIRPDLVASRSLTRALLDRFPARDAHIRQVRTLHDRYVTLVDEELRLADEGRPDQADAFDVAQVDPAFEATLEVLSEQNTAVAATAARARRWSDVGLCLTVLLALGLTTLVHSRGRAERRTLLAEMEHRALHDPLTGLPNRALLADRFDRALRADERDRTATGLLLIDLDRFKEINDTFGHQHGDALLTQVGGRLNAVLREVDTVARLGGDEFAVLLPDMEDMRCVAAVAAELQAALQAPFRVADVELDVEASIGAVISGEHGTDATTLMQRADIAMYAAKKQNLEVSTYDAAVDQHTPDKLVLLGDLRRALTRDELVLHYQPKVDVSSGKLVGVEALVRWQHPDRGLVFPDCFIPLAEHTGLIGPLTRYVLSAALAQTRAWADVGRPVPVSVNLSARNLLDECLPGQVAELLAEHGVTPELLELEVTESAIMSDPARAQRLLEALAALGVRLSIDDFGAGYTSLAQLKNLPVSQLKIDKSFVTSMTTDRRDALIVHSVVDLGHNLGLRLVAEGVGDEHTLSALKGYGCDVAQGNHLSRPLTADAFDRWRAFGPGEAARSACDAVPRPRRSPVGLVRP